MSGRVLDLNDLSPAALDGLGLSELEAIVAVVQRLREHQAIDPELRATILRRIDEAVAIGRITEAQGDAIRAELDEAVPAAVLNAHWREITPGLDRPTIGAFPRRERQAPDIAQWYRDDPRRLLAHMREVSRFTQDEDRILEAVAAFAERVGIPDDVAEDVLVEGLAQLRAERRKGSGHAS